MPKIKSKAKWQGASLKEALDGELPVFLGHRSYQYGNRLPEALTSLGMENGSALGVGAILRIPSVTANVAEKFMSQIDHVPLRITDPEIWKHPDAGWSDAIALGSNALSWSYLSGPPPKVSATWVKSVLEVQRALGATVLLSANGWVPEANAAVALRKAMEYVHESRRQVGDAPMWVNLTMDYRWLSDSALRNILIDEILESNERDWYLRFWWPEVPTRYGQILDGAILGGYKTLAQELAIEEKRLYLPNAGLTGWVATALGAAGFSTGQAWPEQAFARQKVIAIKRNGPPPPPIPRIFDSTVLHTMEYNEFLRIRSFPDHKTYSTAYLDEIDTDGHTVERAGLHYLTAAGNLTARLSSSRPNMVALRRARKGQKFAEDLPLVDRLTGINRPLHLPGWMQLLK